MVLEDILLDAGYEVMTCSHAGGAVRLLRDYPGHFSALVTDVHMPGKLTRMDLVSRVREAYSDLPIIVSLGRPDVLTPRWIDAHKVTVVDKPCSPQTLVEMVRRMVN